MNYNLFFNYMPRLHSSPRIHFVREHLVDSTVPGVYISPPPSVFVQNTVRYLCMHEMSLWQTKNAWMKRMDCISQL